MDQTDQDILRGCISGDSQAREAFVRRVSDLVYRSVQYTLKSNNVLSSQSDLEDLHNTVFVRLFENRCKKLRQYKGTNGCSVLSWVRLVTVRTVIDHLRKSHTDALTREGKSVPIDDIINMQGQTPEPWTLMEKEEQSRSLREGLQSLLPRDRLFVKLHFLEEMSITQVAEIMGLSENNAHSIKHRVIDRLKKWVAQNTKDIIQ